MADVYEDYISSWCLGFSSTYPGYNNVRYYGLPIRAVVDGNTL